MRQRRLEEEGVDGDREAGRQPMSTAGQWAAEAHQQESLYTDVDGHVACRALWTVGGTTL